MFNDVRTEWRISAIETQLSEIKRQSYEISTLRRNLDYMEHTLREARADADGLRNELETQKRRTDELETKFEEFVSLVAQSGPTSL